MMYFNIDDLAVSQVCNYMNYEQDTSPTLRPRTQGAISAIATECHMRQLAKYVQATPLPTTTVAIEENILTWEDIDTMEDFAYWLADNAYWLADNNE